MMKYYDVKFVCAFARNTRSIYAKSSCDALISCMSNLSSLYGDGVHAIPASYIVKVSENQE